MDTLGQRVKSLRKESGLTQTQLGELVGVGRDTINNIELDRNKTINSPIIKLLAMQFDVNDEWLETGQGSPDMDKNKDLASFLIEIKTGKNQFAAKYIDFLASLTPEEWKIFEEYTSIMKRFYETIK